MNAIHAEKPVVGDASTDAPADPLGVAVTIAALRRRHLRSIVRIQSQHPHTGWSVGLWMNELRREHDRVYVVALVGRQVVGYAGVLLQGDDAHVTTIGVDEQWQRHRLGTQMMLVLAHEARARGARNLTLEVRSSNVEAIGLYRRFGLAPAGVRKNYYADLHEDALIMWAHDIDGDGYAARLAGIEHDLVASGFAATALDGLGHRSGRVS